MPKPGLKKDELLDLEKIKALLSSEDTTGGLLIAKPETRDGTQYAVSIDPENAGFIQFKRADPLEAPKKKLTAPPPKREPNTGKMKLSIFVPERKKQSIQELMAKAELKFHIALPDHYHRGEPEFAEEEGLRAKAWNIISEKLMRPGNNVHAFKLLNPLSRFSELNGEFNASQSRPNETSQYAKDVAVYARESDKRSPQEWVALMKDINDTLAEAGIPGHLAMPDGGSRKTTPLGNSPYVCFRCGYSDPGIFKAIKDEGDKVDFKQPAQTAPTSSL